MQSIGDLAQSFGRHLRAEGRSDRTVVIYRQAIGYFSTWLAEEEGVDDPRLEHLDRALIRAWLAGMADRGLEAGTIRIQHKGLARFCGWLVAEGEMESNPMKGLDAPLPTIKPVPVLSDDELATLLKACSGRSFADRRDEAVIRLFLDTGMRVSEMCGLTVAAIDLEAEMALVAGKGRKVRPVYFSARTSRALDRYIRIRAGHRWAHLDALMLGQRGGLSPWGVRTILEVRSAAAGVEGVHPHRFRHTFAHDFLVSGGQERDLKRLAGWSSDVMLERYGASAADARAAAAARRMRRGDRV